MVYCFVKCHIFTGLLQYDALWLILWSQCFNSTLHNGACENIMIEYMIPLGALVFSLSAKRTHVQLIDGSKFIFGVSVDGWWGWVTHVALFDALGTLASEVTKFSINVKTLWKISWVDESCRMKVEKNNTFFWCMIVTVCTLQVAAVWTASGWRCSDLIPNLSGFMVSSAIMITTAEPWLYLATRWEHAHCFLLLDQAIADYICWSEVCYTKLYTFFYLILSL